MTESVETARLPLESWDVEALRFTVFPSPSADIQPNEWWFDVANEEPDERREQPKQGTIVFRGGFAEGVLVLSVRPLRMDWHYQGPSEQEDSPEATTAGDFGTSLSMFVDSMQRWMDSGEYPLAKRLAFGAVLLHEVGCRQEGYELLQTYLRSVEIDTENSRDFAYQINRPRASRDIPDLVINRLSKWSVVTVTQAELQLPQRITQVTSQSFYGRIELDVNSAVDYEGEFDGPASRNVLGEFVKLVEEIAREGDVP